MDFTTVDFLEFNPVYVPVYFHNRNRQNLIHSLSAPPVFTPALSQFSATCLCPLSLLPTHVPSHHPGPTLHAGPQPWKSTACRSPVWQNVCVELRSALSWRTTVCPFRGRRSWRRCPRRRWQSTTSAAYWTNPQMWTWDPGMHFIQIEIVHEDILKF